MSGCLYPVGGASCQITKWSSYKNVYDCHGGCLGNGESLTGAIANKAYAKWLC